MREMVAAILAIVVATGASLRAADLPMPSVVATEQAATTTAATPTTAANQGTLPALPVGAGGPLTRYAPGAGPASGCCGHCPWDPKDGHCPCLRRIVAWATYCPKERVCSLSGCNSCGYKGVLPVHLLWGRWCVNGCGMHATYPNPTCCHGCNKGCANGGCH